MIWLAYLISSSVIAAAALLQWQVLLPKDELTFEPAGMDLLAKSFLDKLQSQRAPLIVAVIWLLVSFIVDLGGPGLAGRADFLGGWLQRILMINYCILVPILLGVYIWFGRSIKLVIIPKGGSAYHLRVRRFLVFQIAICTIALLSQYATILTQTRPQTATPPVLWADPVTWQLNWQGAAHTALRGLDALMALGLVCTLVMVWVRKQLIGGSYLLDPHTKNLRSPVRCFAQGLITIMGLGSLIFWFHFATIIQHRAEEVHEPPASAQFVTSGWIFWAFCWISMIILVIDIFFNLYRRAIAERALSQEQSTHNLDLWPVRRWLFFTVVIVSVGVEPITAFIAPIALHTQRAHHLARSEPFIFLSDPSDPCASCPKQSACRCTSIYTYISN
jgi:hypothetical protein